MNIPHRYFIYFHHYEFQLEFIDLLSEQKHGKQAVDKETYQFIYIQFNGHAYKNRHRCYSRDELRYQLARILLEFSVNRKSY